MEKRRPRHPHPEGSQGGVCQAEVSSDGVLDCGENEQFGTGSLGEEVVFSLVQRVLDNPPNQHFCFQYWAIS